MLSRIVPSIFGVCLLTSTSLASVPSIPSTNNANPSHKKAATASLLRIAIIARKPNNAPKLVNP